MTVYLGGETYDAGPRGPLVMLYADSPQEFETFTARAGIDLGNTAPLYVVAHTLNEIQARLALAFGAVLTDEWGYEDWQAERAGAHKTCLAIAIARAEKIDREGV